MLPELCHIYTSLMLQKRLKIQSTVTIIKNHTGSLSGDRHTIMGEHQHLGRRKSQIILDRLLIIMQLTLSKTRNNNSIRNTVYRLINF